MRLAIAAVDVYVVTVGSIPVDGLLHGLRAHRSHQAPVELVRGVVGGTIGEVVGLAECLVQGMPLVRASLLTIAHAPVESLACDAVDGDVLHEVHRETVGRGHHNGTASGLDLVDDHSEEVGSARHNQVGDGGRLVHREVVLNGEVADDGVDQRRQPADGEVPLHADVAAIAQLVLFHGEVAAMHGEVAVYQGAQRLQRVGQQVLEPSPALAHSVLHGLLHPAPGTKRTEQRTFLERDDALGFVVLLLAQVFAAEHRGHGVHPCLDFLKIPSELLSRGQAGVALTVHPRVYMFKVDVCHCSN